MEWAANWNRRQWVFPRLQVLKLSFDLPNSAESFSYTYTYHLEHGIIWF